MEVASVNVPTRLSKSQAVAFAASQRTRHPEWRKLWRNRLEVSLLRCREESKFVIYSLKTPIGYWIKQFAERLKVDHVRIIVGNEVADADEHFIRLQNANAVEITADLSSLPLADRIVWSLTDEAYAIDIHRGSKSERLARNWIKANIENGSANNLCVFDERIDWADSSVAIKMLTCRTQQERHGAVELANVCSDRRALMRASECVSPIVPYAMFLNSQLNSDQYLVHCTRARDGQWPAQTEIGYSTEVILCNSDLSANPLESLINILSQRRLVATHFLKRGGFPSVSFSAVSLNELLDRRRYRSHLHRWDWEPYGIAIRRAVLEQSFHCKPVSYLLADQLEQQAADQQWICQPDRREDGGSWSEECEWRTPVDVRLAKIAAADGFIFVPTIREAQVLSSLSPFPIVVSRK